MKTRVHRHTPCLLLALCVVQTSAIRADAQVSTPAAERPNTLWIIAEDMGRDLGIYGTPELRTPNLDRLARQGMHFTHAFTTSPVCSPSRSALNTGMYQTAIGAHNHRSYRPDDPSGRLLLPAGVKVISDWLRDAGYFTANVIEFPADIGFVGTGKTDWNFTYPGDPFDSHSWSDLALHQPFYAQVNLPEAHRGNAWESAHEQVLAPADPTRVSLPPYYPDHPIVREDWAQYLNAVMSLDRKVGAILELLERDGLAANTIVIFMSDHGRATVRGKQWPYDSGLHVPLIIHWPQAIPEPARYVAGGASDQMISALDVTATTLALAGVPRPTTMQGRVVLGDAAEPAREYVFAGRDRGDETVDRIRTVRSRQFRYLRNYYPERPFLQTNRYKEARYPAVWVLRSLHARGRLTPSQAALMAPTRPPEELYDLTQDPHEISNLADSPAHEAVLMRMRALLDEWIEETGDQGRVPEDPAVVRHYEERAKRNHDERIEALWKQWGIREADGPS